MASASDDIAIDPVERAIERLRVIYRSWTRETTVAQMRSDWDAAFAGCSVPVTCQPVSAGGVRGEWIVPANAPRDKAILYCHGGGFRIGVMNSSGSGTRLLTNAWQDEGPSWAPNGQFVMFHRTERGSGEGSLYSVGINGGTPRRMPTPLGGSDPSWSPLNN